MVVSQGVQKSMKKSKVVLVAVLSALTALPVFARCAGIPKDSNSNQAPPAPEILAVSPNPKASPRPGSDEEAALFLEKAREAQDNNHLTEAIQAYITVLSIAAGNPGSTAAADAARAAETELTRIGTRLSIEPQEVWLDPSGKQISGSTRSIGKETSLQPAVYLYENFGSGKAPIPDAPIFFEFVENSGIMNGFVSTDAFGRANTALLKVADSSKPATVRATPVFKSRGYAYAFKTAMRDFNYLPPSNTVLALSLSRSELGNVPNSLTTDIIAPQLKAIGLQVLPLAGQLRQESFLSALQGDTASIASLLSQAKAGYLLLVFVELDSIKQYEYQGKLYNMYSAYGKANLRLMRPDGTIVFSFAIERIKGDGGTRAKAVDSAYIQAHDGLSKGLNSHLQTIGDAIAKD